MAENWDVGREPPNITSFWKFGDGRVRHFNLGTTSANTCFYSWTAVYTVHLLDMLQRGGSVAVAVLVMTGDW